MTGPARTVCVAGGTSGINLGIARRFAQTGCNVFVFSRSGEKVEAAIAELDALGASSAGCVADVRQPDQVITALDRCAEAFGPIDVLVSGAAGNFVAPASRISSNGFRAVIEIDVLGTHHVMTAAYPHLRRPGACVINISAAQASVAMVGQAHVCAAKAGVDMLTRTLALEWGAEGIRVNSVLPGPIDGTEGVARLMPDEATRAEKLHSIPLRRFGRIEDVAALTDFLASEGGSFITGAVIPVDGGAMLNPMPTRMEKILA